MQPGARGVEGRRVPGRDGRPPGAGPRRARRRFRTARCRRRRACRRRAPSRCRRASPTRSSTPTAWTRRAPCGRDRTGRRGRPTAPAPGWPPRGRRRRSTRPPPRCRTAAHTLRAPGAGRSGRRDATAVPRARTAGGTDDHASPGRRGRRRRSSTPRPRCGSTCCGRMTARLEVERHLTTDHVVGEVKVVDVAQQGRQDVAG